MRTALPRFPLWARALVYGIVKSRLWRLVFLKEEHPVSRDKMQEREARMAAPIQRRPKKSAPAATRTTVYLSRTDRHIATIQVRHGFAARSAALFPGLTGKKNI